MLGFDVNTFVVVETKTNVRVQWQDKTETCEEARDLFPYLNVDDHDVWPGETVIMRPDENTAGETSSRQPGQQPALTEDRHRLQFEGMWRAFSSVATPETPLPTPEYMRIKKVGVVQTANPADRVAKVKWFVDPSVEVAGGIMIPGSRTGQLAEREEDASFYEIMAHQALGCRRGDFVLIAPERPPEEDPAFQAAYGNLESAVGELNSAVSSAFSNSPARGQTPDTNGPDNQLSQMVDSLRGMVDGGLLSNLSATLGNSAHPQLQAVSRMLNQFPALMTGQQGSPNLTAQTPSHNGTEDAYLNEAPSWIGEVVDLGLDGLITVRLGALDQLVDVRVPIERLHIIFNEEMDLGDSEDDDDEESDEDTEGEFSDDDDLDDEPEVIEERVIYEGGQRLDNGGEEDWLTDEDADADDMDIDSDNYSTEIPSNKKDGDLMEVDEKPTTEEQEEDKEASKKLLDPPPLPDNVPAPEAFAISTSERTPPRFAVLDSEIPTDHAFASQHPTQMTTAFARRINKEHKILSTSLPEGILVRTWESRLDLLRVMIIGPLNTPYELAPFVFDFYFPATFPTHPPKGHFHSWTNGVGRVNPNLYEDGKICLSLLGTWHAERKNEGWTASGSSVLQLLVSLMGLVLVREPWYSMFSLSLRS
jgi:ubiquitin-conjugating enzyme E2 O